MLSDLRYAARRVVTRFRVWALGLAFLVVLMLAAPRSARAFEGEWHLGGGIGFVVPRDAYGPGGALALHLAYGLSDMFDARLEVRSSLHDLSDAASKLPGSPSERNSLSQGMVGLAYKLDVIEWVPYIGVRAGYYRFGEAPRAESKDDPPVAKSGGTIGTMLGVDYAISRSAGVGVELDYDTLLPRGGIFAALLHVEYRWGF